jgi:hypothetical protein
VREAYFRDPGENPPIPLSWSTRALCVLLIGGILLLGVAPARVIDTISSSLASVNRPSSTPPVALIIHAPTRENIVAR